MISVDTTFASSSTTRRPLMPLISGVTLKNYFKCVSKNIHNFILLPSFVLSFIHIYVLTLFFKLALAAAGWTPTTWSHKSNSRGIGGILSWPRHQSSRRIKCETWLHMLGIVRDLILYIWKLVVRPISWRRRGRSLLSVYVHDDLVYLMVSFICSSLYTYST